MGDIHWESKTKSQNTETSFNKLQPKCEHVFLYKRKLTNRFNLIVKSEKKYPLVDEKGSYREHILEVMNSEGIRGRATMVFDISDEVATVSPEKGKQWKLGQDQVAKYKQRGDLFIRNNQVIIKMRRDDERNLITEPFWGFMDKNIGTAESAKSNLKRLFNDTEVFDTVKPVEMIYKLLFHSTDAQSIVLDFFSGSATTAHAVMKLNAEDGGNRKYIMVQLPQVIEENKPAYTAGYRTIDEIGRERIRRAAAKIKEETSADIDYGFMTYKLVTPQEETLYKVVRFDPSQQLLLKDMISIFGTDKSDGKRTILSTWLNQDGVA